MARFLLLASAAALVTLGLAGCTSPNASGDQSPTRSAAPTVISSPAPVCALAPDAKLTAPDEVTVIVELTNSGTGSCTLQGNPTVTFLDDTGKPVQVDVQAGSGEQFSGAPVTVPSGGHAYLTFAAGTAGSCTIGAAKLVIGVSGAPNTTAAALGSTTFCTTPAGAIPQSYPVTDQPTGLS